MSDVQHDRNGWHVVLDAVDARVVASVIERWRATVPADGPAAPVRLRDVHRVLLRVVELAEAEPAPAGDPLPRNAVTAVDAAERLGVRPGQLAGLVKRGELLGENRPGVGLLIFEPSIEAYETRRRCTR